MAGDFRRALRNVRAKSIVLNVREAIKTKPFLVETKLEPHRSTLYLHKSIQEWHESKNEQRDSLGELTNFFCLEMILSPNQVVFGEIYADATSIDAHFPPLLALPEQRRRGHNPF